MHRIHWLSSHDAPDSFPDPRCALREPDGLLAAGGDLSVDRLLAAYERGIFPWYEEGQPVLWWSPDPRTIMRPGAIHVSRSLRRTLRRGYFSITFDREFTAVMDACAQCRPGQSGTWITPSIQVGFSQLHRLGWAHSVEIWSGETLAGGLYGLAMGKVFFGESMFSRKPDASKVAMAALMEELEQRDFALLDCQVASSHLTRMGAEPMPRDEFLAMLTRCCDRSQSLADLPATQVETASLAAASRVANAR